MIHCMFSSDIISDFLRKVKVRHKSFPKEAVLVLNGKRIEKSKNLSKLLDEQYNATETTYARAFTFLVFDNEEAWEEYHPFFFATCWKHPWATTTLTLLIIGLFALFMGSFTSSSQGDDTTPSQAKRKTQEMSPSSLSSHSLAVEKASIFATKEESNHLPSSEVRDRFNPLFVILGIVLLLLLLHFIRRRKVERYKH